MTKLSELISNNFSLSPTNYNTISNGNAERIKLKDLLDRPLEKKDNGSDVGFSAYLSQGMLFTPAPARPTQRTDFAGSYSCILKLRTRMPTGASDSATNLYLSPKTLSINGLIGFNLKTSFIIFSPTN